MSKKKNKEQLIIEKYNGALVGVDPKDRHTNKEIIEIMKRIREEKKEEDK